MEQKNNFIEEWIRWNLKDNFEGCYYIEMIKEVHGNLEVILEHCKTKNKLKISFCSVFISRHIDESLNFIFFEELYGKYGPSFFANWSFFKAQKSKLLDYASLYSGDTSNEYDLTHFVIIGEESCLDVIASGEPNLVWI